MGGHPQLHVPGRRLHCRKRNWRKARCLWTGCGGNGHREEGRELRITVRKDLKEDRGRRLRSAVIFLFYSDRVTFCGGATIGIALDTLLGSPILWRHQLLNPLPVSGPLGILRTLGGSFNPAAALSNPVMLLLLKFDTRRVGIPTYWGPSVE